MSNAPESQPDDGAGGQATRLLRALREGHRDSEEVLLELLYGELHAMASARMARERANHTLQPTALVHDVWVRLMGEERSHWRDRGHFLSIAAQAMRRLLVNHARDRRALKRGGGLQSTPLDVTLAALDDGSGVDLLALDDALEQLGERSPELARVVELRFFAGLEIDEVATATGQSPRTVDRRWLMARSWLHTQLSDDLEDSHG